MSRYSNTKPVVHAVPAVPKGVSKELGNYLRGMQELIETKVGARGNALDRNVTLRELKDAGVVQGLDAAGRFTPNTANAQNRGFTNTGTMRMFTSKREKSFRSSTHTFTHGLGRIPDLVQVRAICTVADGDTFEPGDIVVLPGSVVETDGDDEGCTVMLTAKEVKLFMAENGIATVVEKDGTGGFDVLNDQTEANSRWDVEVRAFIFEESTQGN